MTVGVRRVLKYLWALPCSALGMLAAGPFLLLGASVRITTGVLEIGFPSASQTVVPVLRNLPFDAITFGHVVLATTEDLHEQLRSHERAHVTQYERWGLFFLLAYPLSSLVQVFKGRRPYQDNHFEVQARAAEAGPRESQTCSAPISSPDILRMVGKATR